MASSESIAAVQDSRTTKQSATDAVVDAKSKVSSGLSDVFLSNNTTDNDCCLRVGFALPEIDVQDSQVKPDLSKFCYKCGNFVPFIQLSGHRKYHKALKILGYTAAEDLESYEQLQLKRQLALAESVGDDIRIRKARIAQIDSAFDLLKGELDGLRNVNYVVDYNLECSVKGIGLPSSMQDAIQAIGICEYENSRWKRVMEDTWSYRDCFGGDSNQCYFAVFDGYNGIHAAEIAANELHKHLQREIVKLNTTLHCENLPVLNTASLSCFLDFHKTRQLYLKYIRHEESEPNIDKTHEMHSGSSANSRTSSNGQNYDNRNNNNSRSNDEEQKFINNLKDERLNSTTFPEIRHAFQSAYADTDTLLLHYGKNEHSRVRWSGCSALTCVFQALSFDSTSNDKTIIGWLHLANAGNVRAVLVSDDKARRLSRTHVPWNAKEKNRISNAGGTVTGENKLAKVNGILETTRGLGNHGDPNLKSCIVTDPFVRSIEIDNTTQLLIVASHGLWEVLSEQDAADLALQSLPFREAPQSVHATSSPSINDLLVLKPHTHRLSPLETEASANGADQLTHENTSALGDMQQTPSEKQVPSERPSQVSSSPSSVAEEYEKEQWETESVQDQDGMQTELGSARGHEQELDDISVEHEVVNSVIGSDDALPYLATLVSTIDRPASTVAEHESNTVRYARQISECLVQAAVLAGSRNNITAMVILFPGYAKNCTNNNTRTPSRQVSEL